MTIDDVYRLFGETSHLASILEEQLGNIYMLNERVMSKRDRPRLISPNMVLQPKPVSLSLNRLGWAWR